MTEQLKRHETLKHRIYTIIFGTDTPSGKLFDLVLIYAIIASVIIVILDSATLHSASWQVTFSWLEWLFTIFFTIEYVVRVYVSPNRWRYIFSFYGMVDLLSIVPSYTIFGCLMFIVEGPDNGFTSIPRSIYWTIVTITTVGYGDITPHTILGQIISTLVMLTGYSIIAVPTGIFTAEIAQEMQRQRDSRSCRNCERGSHEQGSDYCRHCGAELPD